MKKVADRIKTIYGLLNPDVVSPNVFAIGMQNPMKDFAYISNYSQTRKPAAPIRFQYTNSYDALSREQKLFYEENGFIVIPRLVSEDCLEIYKNRFRDICDNKVQITSLIMMKDISYRKDRTNERIIYEIQDFMFDEVLFGYCRLPQILKYAECFCGPNIKAMHTMLINKPPDKGTLTSRHPLHQDLIYFPFRPADKIVCSWTALERVNRDNGCLAVIPGTHRGELLRHGYPDWEGGVNLLYHGVSDVDEQCRSRRVHLEMEAGDTVFFHPILIHGSGANRTNGFRKAITCHYAATECDYIDVKGTRHENLAKEFLAVARKKGVKVDDVKNILQLKGRLVQGEENTL
ncbi:hypothetical protein JTE90_026433 [Oedothorax gibbosus]|uniref:phytanoyl-CoA dioxygenase n=1 Tax=Oedothorax gibbosus TaxID=931172 RepID=A0AAV6VQT1_9ARAC|nr:hypothetical protein JTE90_026433 [Oedothorax gibbosus]